MPRPQKDPLRRLTAIERRELIRLRRSRTAPAAEVTRATLILLVSDGYAYQAAARAAAATAGTPSPAWSPGSTARAAPR